MEDYYHQPEIDYRAQQELEEERQQKLHKILRALDGCGCITNEELAELKRQIGV